MLCIKFLEERERGQNMERCEIVKINKKGKNAGSDDFLVDF